MFAGDFNMFFDQKLEPAGGNPTLKKLAVSKLIQLKESLKLCDIWRIKNLKSKTFTFRQRHFSGILQRRLDCLFISNNMQESAKNVKNTECHINGSFPIILFFPKLKQYL